jgi:signal transduction histidine kinase
MSRLDLRGRLTLAVALGALATVTILALGFNIALRSSLDNDADSVLQARAAATLETVTVRGDSVRVREGADSGGPEPEVWIYSGDRALERPPAPAAVQSVADSLATGPEGFTDEDSTDTRLYSTPINDGGRRVGMVVAGLSLEPYETTASHALVASLIFAGVVFVAMTLAARWTINHALRPVAKVTRDAAGWSEHDLEHRFNAGEPRDELTRLAATFDSMLDRLAASLRREQRFSAELSHELRTPLAAILAECELALSREREPAEYRQGLAKIASRARQLQRTLETLLLAARAESNTDRGSADAAEVVERSIEAHRDEASSRSIELRARQPSGRVRVGVDADTAERLLAPLLENACRYGNRFVELEVSREAGYACFAVSDDGPGLDDSEVERIFEPGVRGSAADGRPATDGAGLGLPLARRLARAVGGEIEIEPNADGGRFVARVPLA